MPLDEELARAQLREAVHLGCAGFVDTYKPEVMGRALDLGADIINDIWALRQAGAREAVAAHARCGVCLMHMHRRAADHAALALARATLCRRYGPFCRPSRRRWRRSALMRRGSWDPGIGFGKTVEQNFALLGRQAELLQDGYPVLAGWSRKSSLGVVTGQPVNDRVAARCCCRRAGGAARRRHRARARRA